jgi:hypothetical protein
MGPSSQARRIDDISAQVSTFVTSLDDANSLPKQAIHRIRLAPANLRAGTPAPHAPLRLSAQRRGLDAANGEGTSLTRG